ncbi:MAG: gamma-glutamyltransferase [Alphaproteobacteria bacterium]|nr:gamma-glutamyltransferase [Alphaproteobacteria bacterium]
MAFSRRDFLAALAALTAARGRPATAGSAASGWVVAQERHAAEIGADVLRAGGNAVDAAVATAFALAVTYPRAGNLGGGGFMVIHQAAGARNFAIDFRERAPAAATPSMFRKPDGSPDEVSSRQSALAIGVPGSVAGLTLALEKFGSSRFTLAQLLEAPIAAARSGIRIDDDLADTLPQAHDWLARWPSSARIFSRSDGSSLAPGDLLVQSDLADTLSLIAAEGPAGFYHGAVAKRIAGAIRTAGGILTEEDLASCQARIAEPLSGRYRRSEIVAMPLPSSGGVVLLETLNILEAFNLTELSQGSVAACHLLIEAMKRAYADRARFLGDGRVDAVAPLIAKDYAARLAAGIDRARATPSSALDPPGRRLEPPREGTNTTHFSVVDSAGNAVSTTVTLNFSYGVGLVADGTGVLLNNELDDFTAAPGAANAFGLVGFEANLPGPGKSPLSSMAPTIVLQEGQPVLVTGSPGGSRIISAVLQVIVNVLDFDMDIKSAVAAARLHHQWLPDEVRVEAGISDSVREGLRSLGHTITAPLGQTSANSIRITQDGVVAAPDPRSRGAAAAGP